MNTLPITTDEDEGCSRPCRYELRFRSLFDQHRGLSFPCDRCGRVHMDELKPHLDSDWTVSTGGNALINNAAIVNLDSFGKTYVGGEKYSQETLIQAELISCEPDRLGGQDPNMLVNEAIAFLDNPMAEADQQAAHGVYVPSANDGPTDDGLQHVLGH